MLAAKSPSALDNFDDIVLDCDGVIWRGDDPIPGIDLTLRKLFAQKTKKIWFVSNNSTKDRATYAHKIETMFKITVPVDSILPSSYITASYCHKHLPKHSSLFVIGETGLFKELGAYGFELISSSFTHIDSSQVPLSLTDLAAFGFEHACWENISAVVVGLDREFDYIRLCIATRLLQERPEIKLICCNHDTCLPQGDVLWPGAGAMKAAIEAVIGRKADVVCGKPNDEAVNLLKSKVANPSKTLMVGDRLDTDIIFGKKGGFKTALVTSGVTEASKVDSLIKEDPENKPDHVWETLNDIFG